MLYLYLKKVVFSCENTQFISYILFINVNSVVGLLLLLLILLIYVKALCQEMVKYTVYFLKNIVC